MLMRSISPGSTPTTDQQIASRVMRV